MAELSTIARPYTKAAFEAAREANALDQWSSAIALAAQATQDESVSDILGNPAIESAQKAQIINEISSDANEQFQNFISVLAENNRLFVLPEISTLFESLKAQLEKSVEITVTSAFELTDEQQTKLAQALGKKLECEVNINSEVDASLIGGLLVKAGDLVIDGSVRGKLAKLSEALT